MVERRIVKLKLTQDEAAAYRPPHGIDVIFLEWKPSRNEVIAEFVTSDVQPDPLLRKTAKDIRHELGTTFRHKVLEDDLGTHRRSPKRAMRVEALLDHPFLKAAPRDIKRNADAATDVHELALSKEAVETMQKGAKGAKIEPKEVRRVKTKSINANYDTEVYVFDVGEIDSG